LLLNFKAAITAATIQDLSTSLDLKKF